MLTNLDSRLRFIQNLPRSNIVNCMSVIYTNYNTNSKNSPIANRNFEIRLSRSKYLCIIESNSLTNMNVDIA